MRLMALARRARTVGRNSRSPRCCLSPTTTSIPQPELLKAPHEEERFACMLEVEALDGGQPCFSPLRCFASSSGVLFRGNKLFRYCLILVQFYFTLQASCAAVTLSSKVVN